MKKPIRWQYIREWLLAEWPLVTTILAAVFFLFWRLGLHDAMGDDAHFAFRSLGYFDYMASGAQTTPAQWFGFRPVWSWFSFHDHPPMFFALGHWFMKIFGSTLFSIRLMTALAGIGTLVLSVLAVRRLRPQARHAYLVGLLLTSGGYFVWAGRMGFLEGVLIFWFALAIWAWTRIRETGNWPAVVVGAALGCALLTKYTTLFILPMWAVYFLIWERDIFRSRRMWLGVLVFFAVISPLIIYNSGMYLTRGHLDMQLADLFGQAMPEWPDWVNRVTPGRVGWSPFNVANALAAGLSWPVFGLFLGGSITAVIFALRGGDRRPLLPILSTIGLWAGFSIVGAGTRWLPSLMPFFAIAAAVGLLDLGRVLRGFFRPVFVFAVGACLAAGLLFVYNTFFVYPRPAFAGADLDPTYAGFTKLDRRLDEWLSAPPPSDDTRRLVRKLFYSDIREEALPQLPPLPKGEPFRYLVVIDSNASWFPAMWTGERRRFYEGRWVLYSQDFFRMIRDNGQQELFAALQGFGFFGVRFVELVGDEGRDPAYQYTDLADIKNSLGQALRSGETITNQRTGKIAFRVYDWTFPGATE